jgi:hypothetical protein
LGVDTMKKNKVENVINELLRSGFYLTMDDLFQTTADNLLKKYCISAKLSEDEKGLFIQKLVEVCWNNQLRKDFMNKKR